MINRNSSNNDPDSDLTRNYIYVCVWVCIYIIQSKYFSKWIRKIRILQILKLGNLKNNQKRIIELKKKSIFEIRKSLYGLKADQTQWKKRVVNPNIG